MMSHPPPSLARPLPHPAFARYPHNGTSNSALFRCQQAAGAEQGWGFGGGGGRRGAARHQLEVCVLQNIITDPLPVPTLRDGPHGRPSPRCLRRQKLCPSNSAKVGRTEIPPPNGRRGRTNRQHTRTWPTHLSFPAPSPAPRAPTVRHQPSGHAPHSKRDSSSCAVPQGGWDPLPGRGPRGRGARWHPSPAVFGLQPGAPHPPRYPLAPPRPGAALPHRSTPSAVGRWP
jgi:hypothetical protein